MRSPGWSPTASTCLESSCRTIWIPPIAIALHSPVAPRSKPTLVSAYDVRIFVSLAVSVAPPPARRVAKTYCHASRERELTFFIEDGAALPSGGGGGT